MGVSLGYERPRIDRGACARTTAAELIAGLSGALDLAQGQPVGHAVRTCLIGLRIAEELQLSQQEKRRIYYASLLKDAGSSANASKVFHLFGGDEIAAKREASTIDWSRKSWAGFCYALRHVKVGAPFPARVRNLAKAGWKRAGWALELTTACYEQGAEMARKMGFCEEITGVIQALGGHQQASDTPLGARVLTVAQTLEVFYTQRSPKMALDAIQERSGGCFHPEVVRAALASACRGALFSDLETGRTLEAAIAAEPMPEPLSEERADEICRAFSAIADAKSPFTVGHSEAVAHAAEAIASALGLTPAEARTVRRAALLHDLGKLAVPNSILEKPEKLEPEEWQVVKKHPYQTMEILRRVYGFGEIAEVAASHHEKLDGSGYYRNLTAPRMPIAARIVAVADAFDALSSRRPQRPAYPPEAVCGILRLEAPLRLDGDCVEALIATHSEVPLRDLISSRAGQECRSKSGRSR